MAEALHTQSSFPSICLCFFAMYLYRKAFGTCLQKACSAEPLAETAECRQGIDPSLYRMLECGGTPYCVECIF